MLDKRWENDRHKAEKKKAGSGKDVPRPSRAGLCVSLYEADYASPGYPGYDLVYFVGFATSVIQLGSIPQWSKKKWECRRDSEKAVILSRGNGSKHAIVVIGRSKGLDVEDLAAGPTNVDVSASYTTRITLTILATLWILLFIAAAGIKQNTWFLLAIGGIGIL
ncbi:hypothetical protein DL766_005664 [Monosporascus sp. MC13-8B]|uniref:Autophagy-related protein n=1 Tax=Monosporascus cannonballus TaxID=155416 RepID=A0ABY0H522_9PEZI|nr:hypothetical protein DL762_005364 [Monosporascus cannonballus]RYO86836.1 hypothetical protein DL763_006544 [Monosporascus cannonballus]RYP28833.1 hypothetical protein DL766_005664 [Monosporascus sp. MC13-8B]